MGRKIQIYASGRKIFRPYGHHQKQLVRLFGDLKLGLQNVCDKTRKFMMFGNEIIMKTLFGLKNHIIQFLNTLKIILLNGIMIDFSSN
jgi:hypothetical protein